MYIYDKACLVYICYYVSQKRTRVQIISICRSVVYVCMYVVYSRKLVINIVYSLLLSYLLLILFYNKMVNEKKRFLGFVSPLYRKKRYCIVLVSSNRDRVEGVRLPQLYLYG